MKTCQKCPQSNPLEFYKRTRSKDGLCSLCKVCHKKFNKEWSKANPRVGDPEYQREYAQANKAELNAARRERYKEKRSSVDAVNKKYQLSPKGLASTRHRNAKYRAAKLNALPKWITEEQLSSIKNIYANCPFGYHVDHIMPLQGENVSGLHVPWNLQYLPASENIRKSNSC
jgi:hypothetical protein